jgi:hypothetical protein
MRPREGISLQHRESVRFTRPRRHADEGEPRKLMNSSCRLERARRRTAATVSQEDAPPSSPGIGAG